MGSRRNGYMGKIGDCSLSGKDRELSPGGLLSAFRTLIPGAASWVPRRKTLSTVVAKMRIYSRSPIAVTLWPTKSYQKIDLPMLPDARALRMAVGIKMDF